MARAKRKKRERARRLHQEPIVREVAAILAAGTPTKFRWSSACHHALRASMCMKGWKWHAADEQAGKIVTLALHRIGSGIRPTWLMARPEPEQREYYRCAACGGRPEAGNLDKPWCSDECRLVLRQHRVRSAGQREDAVARRVKAFLLTGVKIEVVHWDKSERHCQHCNRPYTPNEKEQRFCSIRCAMNVARGPIRDCLACAEPFTPTKAEQKYCSRKCTVLATQKEARRKWAEKAKRYSLVCCVCVQAFTSTRSRQRCCGDDCRTEHERRRNRATGAIRELAEAA